MANVRYDSHGNELVEIKVRFKVDTRKFARLFGIEIPDDEMDVVLTGDPDVDEAKHDGVATDEAIAEDAATFSFANKHVKTDLAHCKAQNPMTCRFHGVMAVANELNAFMQAQGVNGDVNVEIEGVDTNGGKQVIQVSASIVAPKTDADKVQAALDAFYKLDGVYGKDGTAGWEDKYASTSGTTPNEGKGSHTDFFDIDILDPNAAARWKFGQNAASQQAVNNTQQQTTPTPQPAQPAAPANTPAAGKKQRPYRPRGPKKTAAPVIPPEAPAEEPVIEQTTKPEQQPSDDNGPLLGPYDDSAPTLFPGDAPKEPPKWDPPYTQAELDTLAKYVSRIGKTVYRLNEIQDKEDANPGYLATYLAKGNGDPNMPYANLPSGLQKWKNGVDVANLKNLADKDTDGQVKKLCEIADKIDATEASGWKDRTGYQQSDVVFDPSKYADPYAADRESYENYTPAAQSRDAHLAMLKEIDESGSDDAPKDEADKARTAAELMTQLEDSYAQLLKMKNAHDGNKNPFDRMINDVGQQYYKANKAFSEAMSECHKWKAKQSYMKNTIADTIQGYKDRGEEVPEQLLDWENYEKLYEDDAWRVVANHLGLNVADKVKCMENFKKNMRKVAMEGINYTSQSDDWMFKFIEGTDELHSTCVNYAVASNKCFGTKFPLKREGSTRIESSRQVNSKQAKAIMHQMHLYSTLGSDDVSTWSGIVLNNKKVVMGFFNENGNSASHLGATGNKDSGCLNPTFLCDATCTGLVHNNYRGGLSLSTKAKDLFTKDLTSSHSAGQIFDLIGCGRNNETWILGGLRSIDQAKEITFSTDYYKNRFSDKAIKRCKELGVKVYYLKGPWGNQKRVPMF